MKTLDDWLSCISNISSKPMDLGIVRIESVAKKLGVTKFNVPVITVAGTNGKGSTVAIMAAILQAQGLKVGTTTSPHLHKFNERISISGENISESDCCEFFSIIENTRGDIKITYFEFAILAALLAFKKYQVDIILLEVGLGGRLDAVNCVQNDISVITSIDLDHTDWLGNTREQIAFEKAGIFKNNTIAICGEPNCPEAIIKTANDKKNKLLQINKDFYYNVNSNNTWDLEYGALKLTLPKPRLKTQNAATAIITLLQLKKFNININNNSIITGLKNVKLAGRFQIINNNGIDIIYDVAHNPASTKLLAENLLQHNCNGKTIAVFGALKTKDYLAMIKPLVNIISDNNLHCASLSANNALPGETLATNINNKYNVYAIGYSNIAAAFNEAKSKAREGDRIVVFGSFYAVAEVQSSTSIL